MKVPSASLKAKNLLKIPENLSFEEACLSEPFACVINGQELSQVKEGDTVVIIGAGPIGCMHAELARLNGAKRVILADLIQERLDLAKEDIPADRFINTSTEDLKEVTTSFTSGQGAEVVIVAAPSSKAQEDALSIVAKRGRLNLFGGLPKVRPTATFISNIIHYREIFVHGSYGSVARQQEKALQLFSTKQIEAKKFISFTFSLDRILEGFKATEEKKGYRAVITME
ncbi:MAG: putative zinc-type alcohol dehydrogenase-like protein YjmD [candidate division WS2 bacterium]|nr:putative zinc-type alcohol dehydrogenase-like protein YjmD [Candidatus Psychracetigena formicireducens]